MTRSRYALVLAVTSLVLAACGKSPAAPAVPQNTVQITIVTTDDVVMLETTEAWTATATLSDGSQETVTTGTWSVSNAAAASVDNDGHVRGLTPGETIVTLTYKGLTTFRTIRVLPDYQGRWTGSHVGDSCEETGDAVGLVCSEGVYSVDAVRPVTFQLAQAGDSVTGTVTLGTLVSEPFAATILNDGSLRIQARAALGDVPFKLAWSLLVAPRGQMTGTLLLIIDTSESGSAVIRTHLGEMTWFP